MPRPKFNTGDRVILVDPRVGWSDWAPKGSVGTVIDIDYDDTIKVKFDNDYVSGWWLDRRFEHHYDDGKTILERKISRMWDRQNYVKKGLHHATV